MFCRFVCFVISLGFQAEFLASQGSFDAVRVGDIVFKPEDLLCQRVVLAKPGDRIVLLGHGNDSKPEVMYAHTVVENSGSFAVPWLPNVTVSVVSYDDLRKNVAESVHTLKERRFVSQLSRALDLARIAVGSKKIHVRCLRITKLLRDALGTYCPDDAILGTTLERRLRGVLQVFAADWRRIRFVVKHMMDICYLDSVEICFCTPDQDGESFVLRLHVWQNFGQLVEQKRDSVVPTPGAHTHDLGIFASTQLTGASKHSMFFHGGTPQPLPGVAGHISWMDKNVPLAVETFQGNTMDVSAETTHIFPPRWIHDVASVTDQAMTLELRLPGGNCGHQTPIVAVKPGGVETPLLFNYLAADAERNITDTILSFLSRNRQDMHPDLLKVLRASKERLATHIDTLDEKSRQFAWQMLASQSLDEVLDEIASSQQAIYAVAFMLLDWPDAERRRELLAALKRKMKWKGKAKKLLRKILLGDREHCVADACTANT